MSDQLPLNLVPLAQDELRPASPSQPAPSSERPHLLEDPQVCPTQEPALIADETSQPPDDPTPEPPRPNTPKSAALEIPEETREQIVTLSAQRYGTRKIATRVGLSRKQVRRVLSEAIEDAMVPPAIELRRGAPAIEVKNGDAAIDLPSKLTALEAEIRMRVEQRLTVTRILREIRPLGYTGGRTILAERVRKLRAEIGTQPSHKAVKKRFETALGEEMQVDWSPYTVMIAGEDVRIHALACLLCASRKLFLCFFRDERQSTLLEGLARACEYFLGSALRLVLDNMATAVLGRFGADGQPVWHPRFIDFARHYGFAPFACLPRDPDRKGKDEKAFRLVEADLLRGSTFTSWDDLAVRTKVWLDETPGVANQRKHGTTGLVPNEVWQAERELLVQLPPKRFGVHEDGVRSVDRDSTLWIRGTPYTVPAELANRNVAVRLYAEHFEVLDAQGRIAFSRVYVPDSEKGKLVIDPTHYANLPRRRARNSSGHRIDQAFVQRFPTLVPMIDGLRLRTKTLVPIHIRALLRLADRFGQDDFVRAVERAQSFRSFDVKAVEAILEQTAVELDDTLAPLGGIGPAVLGEIETGSFDTYGSLDQSPAADPRPEDAEDESDPSDETEESEGGNGHGA